MHTALVTARSIRGLSSLVVGMPECATYSRFVIPGPEGKQGELHWMYVLDADEVIFGCRAGLVEALRKTAAAGARYLMIIATCVPELIGEDMDGILREAGEIPARLAFVFMGHFTCNSYPQGYWKTFAALGSFMEAKKREARRVNVLGPGPGEKQAMPGLLCLLERQGFRLRFLGQGSSLEDFLEAPDAVLNLVLSPLTGPLALTMEDRFGIPWVGLHDVYGIAAIDRAYDAIAEKLESAWGDAFREERQKACAWQERLAGRLKGLGAVFAPMGTLMPLPLAVYLAGLGLRPLLLHIEEFYPADTGYAQELQALGFDPPVCHMANYRRDMALVEGMSPALCLGQLPGLPPRQAPGKGKIPSVPGIQTLSAQFGYERICRLGEMVLKVPPPARRPDQGE
jgi:nitrogenase molybdenum-iron protein alpha/beta subunit